jgi:predicted HicB family RNase H-like nuclease
MLAPILATEPQRDRRVRVNLKLPPELHQALKIEAARQNTTLQDLIERAIKEQLLQDEQRLGRV